MRIRWRRVRVHGASHARLRRFFDAIHHRGQVSTWIRPMGEKQNRTGRHADIDNATAAPEGKALTPGNLLFPRSCPLSTAGILSFGCRKSHFA
jgi:hypothetical protein